MMDRLHLQNKREESGINILTTVTLTHLVKKNDKEFQYNLIFGNPYYLSYFSK